jgi:peptidoglycan/LPS O-acetylase OafA/YrhL
MSWQQNSSRRNAMMTGSEDQVPFARTQASVTLDAIRGIAALLVTLEHLRYRLFFEFTKADLHKAVLRALFIISGCGHPSVIVFFVLSGFLVGGSLLRAHGNDTWSWKRYLTHRFVRLWIVLIPALFIGLLWDMSTVHVAKGWINPPFVEHRVAQTAAYLGISGFMGNVFFLQDTLVPVFGSNGPLWSLNNEFWYYIMFPLGFFALFPRYKSATRITFAIAFVLLLSVLGRELALRFPTWLFGALLFYLPRPHCGGFARRLTLILYIFGFLGLVKVSFRLPLTADYLLAAATSAMIWVILSARSAANPRSLRTHSSRLLARFSYTLYLVHVPIFTFAGVFLVRDQPWRPTFPHLAWACAIWLATILFAWLIASLTEFRTDRVRDSIEAWSRRQVALRDRGMVS